MVYCIFVGFYMYIPSTGMGMISQVVLWSQGEPSKDCRSLIFFFFFLSLEPKRHQHNQKLFIGL